MEPTTCPSCAAPLRPAATFCLACDTPVAGARRGLSVAEPVAASTGRPLVGLGVVLAALVVAGAVGYGVHSWTQGRHAAARADALQDTRNGVVDLVAAEAGTAHACRRAEPFLAGDAAALRQKCLAIVGADSGARLENVRVDHPSLGSRTGTVRMTATLVDSTGTRAFDHAFEVVKQGKQWRLRWDGKPEV